MPIYEYECTSCCSVLEVFQRITEDPLKTCPDCSGPVRKLLSKSSFQLKGGGWYADGYSSPSSDGSAGKPSADATPEKSPEKKSDKTPDKTKGTGSSKESAAGDSKKESCSAAA